MASSTALGALRSRPVAAASIAGLVPALGSLALGPSITDLSLVAMGSGAAAGAVAASLSDGGLTRTVRVALVANAASLVVVYLLLYGWFTAVAPDPEPFRSGLGAALLFEPIFAVPLAILSLTVAGFVASVVGAWQQRGASDAEVAQPRRK